MVKVKTKHICTLKSDSPVATDPYKRRQTLSRCVSEYISTLSGISFCNFVCCHEKEAEFCRHSKPTPFLPVLAFSVCLLPPVHQPAGVGAPDSSDVVEKIVDLPEAVEPSTSAPANPNMFLEEEEPSIDFPKKLPAGVRVDDKGNVFANNTLLFTKSVSVSARALLSLHQ